MESEAAGGPPHLLGGRREPDRASRVRGGFPQGCVAREGNEKASEGSCLFSRVKVVVVRRRGPARVCGPRRAGPGRSALTVNREDRVAALRLRLVVAPGASVCFRGGSAAVRGGSQGARSLGVNSCGETEPSRMAPGPVFKEPFAS